MLAAARYFPFSGAGGMRTLMALAGAAVLWSCAPTPPASIFTSPEAYAGPTGQIVGTVGIIHDGDDENFNNINQLLFRAIDGSTTGAIRIDWTDFYEEEELHYSNEVEKGSVFILDLPAGQYEFYDVQFYYNNGTYSNSYSAREEFSIPFSVEANRAAYLGSFVAHGVWGKNIFFISIPAGGYFKISDQFERDKGLVAALRPEIPANSIQPRLLVVDAPPFVVR